MFSCVTAAFERWADLPVPPAATQEDYERLIGAGHVFVIADEFVVLGTVTLTVDGATMWLKNLAVLPSQQQLGLGRGLVALGETQAEAAGCTSLRLFTNALMADNIEMYRAMGFTENDRRTEGGRDRVYFTKRVGPREPAT